MPGVGKTQLAAEYVYRFGSEYDVVWWVDAESRASFRLRVAELATALRLDTGPEYGERLRAVRDALRRGRPYGRWLLVLDGADEPHQISDLVPTGPGHVLITSRNPEWGEHNSRMLEIGVYDRAESVAFVRRRAPRLGRPDAQQLAEALGDLPLLLDQTAGWLNDSDLSVDDYIALLEGGIDQDIVKVSQDFPLAFQTAWSILLNKLRETVPESVALLGLCTFFAPGTIPVRILRDLDHQAAPEPVAGLLRDPLLWNRAVNQLRQYSVVSLDSHEFSGDDAALPGEAFYLHRMVHQIVHRDLPEADRAPFAQVVRAALAAADPGRPTDTRLWPRYAEIVPHLEHAQALESTDPAVQNLVLNCLRYLYLSGEYKTGVALGERTLEIWRRLVGDEHPASGTSSTTTPTSCAPAATSPAPRRSSAPPPNGCAPWTAPATSPICAPPAASPPTCGAWAATRRRTSSPPRSWTPTANSSATRTPAPSAPATTSPSRSACSATTDGRSSSTRTRWSAAANSCAPATTGRSPPSTPTPWTCAWSAATRTPSPSRPGTSANSAS